MEVIIAAIIAAVASIIVSVVNNRTQYNKIVAEIAKSGELQAYRLQQLEKKVDKHNSVIERTYRLEKSEALLEEKIDVANHRIKDLESKREN